MNLLPNHSDMVPPNPEDGVTGNAPAHVIEIGPNHRRAITATLVHLDEAICRIERIVEQTEIHSEIYNERNALTVSQKKEVLSEVAAIRDLLREVCHALALQPVTRDAGATISSHCMVLCESVIELQSKYIKGYGEPPEDLANFLDPKSEQLVNHLDRIVRVLGVFRSSKPPP